MATTDSDIRAFSEFALAHVASDGSDLTIPELAQRWQAEREQEEVVAAIREGLEDIEAGRTRPAAEFMRDMRRKYKIPPDA